MSQEQPPIRSRRELRKARDAQQASVSTGTDQRSPAINRAAPARPTPGPAAQAPPGPAPSPPNPVPEQTLAQRSSQIRARDRAALRTIKELEEKEGQLSAGGPPTRRQLRLQQLKEQALTAANPIVPPAAPASKGPEDPKPRPVQESTPPAPKTQSGSNSSAARTAAPVGMTVEQALAARALIAEQAKNQIAKMDHIASLDPEAVDPEILAEQIALAERAAVMNRRAVAKQKLAEQTGVPVPAKDPAGNEPAETGGQNSTAGKRGPRPAPSTATNLAMVTPLEFVQVPGVDRPVMKPPATSHVPVTTRPGSKISPTGSKPAKTDSTQTSPTRTSPMGTNPTGTNSAGTNSTGTKQRRPTGTPRPATSDTAAGRSQVIARAEAAARAAARPKPVVMPSAVVTDGQSGDLFEDLPRIPARSAHGLDPLDAATAGMTRARRNRVLQFCVLAFGMLALISGIILIISGMSR